MGGLRADCRCAFLHEPLNIMSLIYDYFRLGVFSMEGSSKHSVTLDVMPLIHGYLPLPAIRLSRYIPADQKSKGFFYLNTNLY